MKNKKIKVIGGLSLKKVKIKQLTNRSSYADLIGASKIEGLGKLQNHWTNYKILHAVFW